MASSPLKALVPAAGMGTRMRPLTYACPKELLPLGSRPVLHRLMDELTEVGVEEVCVVTSAEKPGLEAYLRRLEFPFHHHFVTQREPKGLGDAILYGREFAEGSPFLTVLGDSLIESRHAQSPLSRMIEAFEETGGGILLGEDVPKERISRYGVMSPEGEIDGLQPFRLKDLIEKPSPEDAPSSIAVSARYLLPFEIFDTLADTPPGKNGEIVLTDAIRSLIREGTPFHGVKLHSREKRWDIGGFETYFQAFEAYARADMDRWKEEMS